MKPIHAALSLCLLAAACASPTPEPETEISSAATPNTSSAACTTEPIGCVTPMTRADAVDASRSNGLGEAAFRLMVRFW